MDLWALKAAGVAPAVTLLFKSSAHYCLLVLGHTICALSLVFLFFLAVVLFSRRGKMKPKLKPTSLLLQGEEQPVGLRNRVSNKKKRKEKENNAAIAVKHSSGSLRRPRFGETTGVRRCQALSAHVKRKIWRSQQAEEGREMRPSIFRRAPGESGEREDSTAAPPMHRWRA